jgi:signal transduction histidine kinase
MNSAKPLQVLIVEDSENDASLLEIELERAGYDPVCHRVETPEAMSAALERQVWDVVIADYVMPHFNGLAALNLVAEKGLDIPFIVVSGHITEETAVEAMKAGAHDYVMKDRLARLGRAIERELREAEVRRRRREAEEEVRRGHEALRRAHDELELRVQQRTAELKTANQKLKTAIGELEDLQHQLLDITETERRRIGLDLHDDLGQRLTGIALMSKGLELRLARNKSNEAHDAASLHSLVQEAINRTRDVAKDLATLDLQEKDLPDALEDLAASAAKLYGITCLFKAEGKIPPLGPNVVGHLYRIAQEAVKNAYKHGKTKRVTIGLANNSHTIVMTVENTGKPYPDLKSHARTGIGVRIMEHRAKVIGASFDIEPVRTRGTRVTCRLPFPEGQ